jgi:hypothetical protein
LAEIAYTALQQQLELSLQGFQYKNQLLLEQANKKMEVDNTYYNRYQDVLSQMNQENAMAEEIRQYNESMALQKQQFAEEKRQFEQSYALEIKQFDENIRQFNEEMARLKKKDAQEHAMEIKRLELQKKQMEQAKLEAQRDYEIKQKQLAMQQSQFNKEMKLKEAQLAESKRQADLSSSGGSGGSGGSAYVSKGDDAGNTKKSNKVKVPFFTNDMQASAWLKSRGLSYSGLMGQNKWMQLKQRGAGGAGGVTTFAASASFFTFLTFVVSFAKANCEIKIAQAISKYLIEFRFYLHKVTKNKQNFSDLHQKKTVAMPPSL